MRDGENKASVVPERNFQLVVPGITGATKSDVAAHQSAADEALQNSGADDLELLHETLEGAAVPLEEVAALLFDDASSLRCYAAWRLLDSPRGRALFKRPKPNADSVAPRDGAEAAALLKQLDAAEAEEEALWRFARELTHARPTARHRSISRRRMRRRAADLRRWNGSAAAATTSAATGAVTTTTPLTRRRSRWRRSF